MVVSAHNLKNEGKSIYLSGIDQTLILKFNLNALYFLEKQYGDINKALEEIQDGQIESMIAIATAALNAGNPGKNFTTEQVGDIIGIDDLERLSEALTDLLGADGKTNTPS